MSGMPITGDYIKVEETGRMGARLNVVAEGDRGRTYLTDA